MIRPWRPMLVTPVSMALLGCAQTREQIQSASIDNGVKRARHEQPATEKLPQPAPAQPMAMPIGPENAPSELLGPQSVDVFIRRALVENRTVQAAFHNVQSLRHRLPQVTALEDPFLSNTIFPIPSVAPQYSLMGYNPYNLTLAQQFPWFGTLRLRGEVAEHDVRVALAELAAAQLDTVVAVKRAYATLHASLRTAEILAENRKILEDYRAIARERLATGGSQQDVIRAETLISELDRNLAENRQNIAAARSALARQIHVRADAQFQTLSDLPIASVPAEVERLQQVAMTVRPELQGRLAAIARDEKAVELARKRAYPNLTLGLTYMDMEKTNATTPITAAGMPNVGLFVAFNLPVNQKKYRAGVCEAQERTLADAKLYEAQQDETGTEIQDFAVQAKVQQDVLILLRDSILPRAKESLTNARSDYAKSNVDYATVQSALREVLQIQIQIVQVEAELRKALASLERAVGTELKEGPAASDVAATPPTPSTAGPFQPRHDDKPR